MLHVGRGGGGSVGGQTDLGRGTARRLLRVLGSNQSDGRADTSHHNAGLPFQIKHLVIAVREINIDVNV